MNTEDRQPKDDFIYFNDEWSNQPTESYRLEILEFTETGIKIYTLDEYNKLIKNDKPDGRRYKK